MIKKLTNEELFEKICLAVLSAVYICENNYNQTASYKIFYNTYKKLALEEWFLAALDFLEEEEMLAQEGDKIFYLKGLDIQTGLMQ